MSFASLNGVRTGGMAGSVRAARPTAQAWNAPAPQVMPGSPTAMAVGALNQPPAAPAASGGQSEVSTQWDNIGQRTGGGMLGTKSQGGAAQYILNPENPLTGGVVAGNQGPQLQQPAAGPGFDPNDPANAALAGYMRG